MKPRYRVVVKQIGGEWVYFYGQHSPDGLAFFNIKPKARSTFNEAKEDVIEFKQAQTTDIGSDIKVMELFK